MSVSLAIRISASILTFSCFTSGQSFDPSVGQRVFFGPPAGPAPMFRIDGARSGRSKVPLPRVPKLVRRIRVAGGLLHGIAVDEASALLISHKTAQLSELDARGKSRWTVRTGAAAPQTAPVVTNDGTRLIVNGANEVIAVRQGGRLRYRRTLLAPQNARAAAPLPLDDGSILIAIGSLLVRLAPDGEEQGRTHAPGSVTALVDTGRSLYAVIESGKVFEWTRLGSLIDRGDFGGRVDDTLTAVSAERLVAVVERDRLVQLDLNQRTSQAYAADTSGTWLSAPAVSPDAKLFVVTAQGLLLGYRTPNTETLRVVLDPALGATSTTPHRTGPPPLTDAAGRFAVVRSGLDPALVDVDGSVRFASGAACVDPVSLVPLSAGQLALACASGLIWLIGDQSPAP